MRFKKSIKIETFCRISFMFDKLRKLNLFTCLICVSMTQESLIFPLKIKRLDSNSYSKSEFVLFKRIEAMAFCIKLVIDNNY